MKSMGLFRIGIQKMYTYFRLRTYSKEGHTYPQESVKKKSYF